ncbi:CRISPR-associated endoribonuclease Cas2 [Candidatus Terasakiella magnetica]|nr:CRISPR-associated endoribonuclease Cas2 [Candidatus Terasakiella magnetica]
MMWVMVLFDLPVGSRAERKRATGFRNFLLDQGFEMVQFSVYARFCSGKEQAEANTRAIEKQVPKYGKVNILFFTDKQYENTISFTGRERSSGPKKPDQLLLF